MKKIVLLLFTVASAISASADSRSETLLSKMSAAVKALGRYEAAFTVTAGEFRADGRYAVDGKAYTLNMAEAEVYCDGRTRYEVNRSLKEITVDSVDPAERNILNNPATGLEFIGEEYESETVSVDGSTTLIRLQSQREKAEGRVIEVRIDNATALPQQLIYRMASDAIVIDISDIRSSSEPLRRFDPAAYSGFELIDFR